MATVSSSLLGHSRRPAWRAAAAGGVHRIRRLALRAGVPKPCISLRSRSPRRLTRQTRVSSRPFSTLDNQILDGKSLAAGIRAEVAEEVTSLLDNTGVVPGLAVILVGDRPDSRTYVKFKKRAAAEVGIESFQRILNQNVTNEEVREAIAQFNADPRVHGILVQLPLPRHLDTDTILQMIPPEKDVDGFHARNVGDLWLNTRNIAHGDSKHVKPLVLPCTAAGVMYMLLGLNVNLSGKEAVVLGRSRIVGMPVAGLLQGLDCTVTMVHSRTKNPEDHIKRADIVIAAIGIPEYVKGDWIKPGAIVIDVGINQKPDPSSEKGYQLTGDVDFEGARMVAGAITPVPGGVGPMTVAMLLRNTLNLARYSLGLRPLPLARRRLSSNSEFQQTPAATSRE
eukprot:CAMPEP_0114499056 /NCGR_PEP_ID=MMETSP0109-20121206/7209_1 /TAXON_ID=29199 /ORGANISM="Chlorarachnion reptans, Strain CCCM449" /LENGTH=394 /DNA_ID=CAMNT_0001676589 /DNA_START=117 /DNA_END=1301 /DNA_ORIENTATION=-